MSIGVNTSITRPALRYLGGKFILAPRIIAHFPEHRVYVEPFGGGGSVLLRKTRSYAEVYNDLDGEVVNLFRVLRDPVMGPELVRLVGLTPFAREEFLAAYEVADDPVERARRMVVRAFMGHGSCASRQDRTTGFRFDSVKGLTRVAVEWAGYPPALAAICRRMSGVTVENLPAADLIADRDEVGVLMYVDPPYVHATRSQKVTRGSLSNGYRYEMADDEHLALVEQLRGVRAAVVLSGYATPLYGQLERDGWKVVELGTVDQTGAARVEVLWLNPAAQAAKPDLFASNLQEHLSIGRPR